MINVNVLRVFVGFLGLRSLGKTCLFFLMSWLGGCALLSSSWAFPANQGTKPELRPNWVEVAPVQIKHFGGMPTKSSGTSVRSAGTKADPHAGMGSTDPHAGLSLNTRTATTTDPHAGLAMNPNDSSDPHAGLAVQPPRSPAGKTGNTSNSQPESESVAEKLRVLAMRMNREQNQVFQRLITLIISPCCWTQPVSLHASSMSDTIKIDLMQRLLAGHSEPQILDAYKKRFGERVLSIPDKSYIFLIPIVASLVALVLVGLLILRWSQRNSSTIPVTPFESEPPDSSTSSAEPASSVSPVAQEGASSPSR